MRRLLAIASLVVACSSSGSAGVPALTDPPVATTPAPAWPEGWDLDFCFGIDQLGSAGTHMKAAAEAGSKFDVDGAVKEAEQAASDAGDASDAFSVADRWPPAHSALVYLMSSAENMAKAANLFKLGVQALDTPTIGASNTYQDKATYQLKRATSALEPLISKYGQPC
jgi:hypothetical protein